MKHLILIPLLLLSACTLHINAEKVEKGIRLCKANEGLTTITVSSNSGDWAHCVNGARFKL